jgi:hypothetical protein
MSVSRKRLQDIVELAEESEMRWRGVKHSSLAFWLRDVAKAVIALVDAQEQNEAEIVALNDVVDDIDVRIDGIVGEVEPDILDFPLDFAPESEGVADLTAVPYVVDYDLAYNEAYIIDDELHVGPLFPEKLEAAAEARKQAGAESVR